MGQPLPMLGEAAKHSQFPHFSIAADFVSARVSRNDFGVIIMGGHRILPYSVLGFHPRIKTSRSRIAAVAMALMARRSNFPVPIIGSCSTRTKLSDAGM